VTRTSLILWHTHQNDVAAMRKLLEEEDARINARDYNSRTPLVSSGCGVDLVGYAFLE
jgi:hypothetical protein